MILNQLSRRCGACAKHRSWQLRADLPLQSSRASPGMEGARDGVRQLVLIIPQCGFRVGGRLREKLAGM